MTMHGNSSKPPEAQSETPARPYVLIEDPVFYGTMGFFALLTTALPGAMGQPNFMPLVQAVALTFFAAPALRRGRVRTALAIAGAWLLIQFLALFLLTLWLPGQAERAIPDGFAVRTDLIQWMYAGGRLPGSLASAPLGRLGELAGVLVGSLVSAGLVGWWVVVRGVNHLAYTGASLAANSRSVAGLLLALGPWRLATLAGYTGLVALLAQPLLNNNWRMAFYLRTQRRLILLAAGLTVIGLLLELALPGLWRSLLAPGGG